MFCKNWKENRVVKQIYKLREEYEFRHLYAGMGGFRATPIEHFFECDCCGNLTNNVENLYHKTKELEVIGICSVCSDLWRVVPIVDAKQTIA